MKTLFVLDASGYLYRSYFAIKNMTNARGESTNALYGFIRSVIKLQKDFRPEHLVAVFDGPSSIKQREAIYSQYKAHRKETPQDLRYQIQWAQKACELMGIPYLNVPHVEADDTMGSIAKWAEQQEAMVYLCTSDKDLCQLVNDHVHILNTFKENQILTPSEVEENFGVPPHLMIDLLAIVGDTSDNVPGIPGFGPKTAAALLKQFGSLDALLSDPSVLPEKKRATIQEHAAQAKISQQLVTLHTDVDFPKDRSFFSLRPSHLSALKEFYASMNFNSLLRDIEQFFPQQQEEKIKEESLHYSLIDDREGLTHLMERLSQQQSIAMAVFGTEQQPLKSEFVGIAFSVEPKTGWYLPANGKLGLEEILPALKKLFGREDIGFYGHNSKYDILVLENLGIRPPNLLFDNTLASYLLNSHTRQHSLDHLMLEQYGKVRKTVKELLGKGKQAICLKEAPPSHLNDFCCETVDYICRLRLLLERQLEERHLLKVLTELELPLLKVLAKMEREGIYVDTSYLRTMSCEVLQLITELAETIYTLAGERFNINSPKQLSEILFGKMGIKPPKKTATGLSTGAEVLEMLKQQYPIAGKILEYRVLEKLRSTYLDALPLEVNPKTKRIHCTFNQTVAATGRLSCQDPNLQNIPIRTEIGRKIRRAFLPEKEGWSYLAADYSQIELRILAHLSKDPLLTQAFLSGEDIHTSTAAHIFNVPLSEVTKEQRYHAKAVNFGIVYGQQAFGLSQELGIDVKEASAFITAYFQRYPLVKAFIEQCKERTRETGKATTYIGRERLIPEIHSKNSLIRGAAERLAMNTPIQGTAADLIKLAMLRIDKKLQEVQSKGYLILQIHDELIFEVPDEEINALKFLVQETMQNVLKLQIPLVVDLSIGKNWAEC